MSGLVRLDNSFRLSEVILLIGSFFKTNIQKNGEIEAIANECLAPLRNKLLTLGKGQAVIMHAKRDGEAQERYSIVEEDFRWITRFLEVVKCVPKDPNN